MPDELPRRNTTYYELGRIHHSDPAWLGWMRECGFPEQQVCLDGWVARDPYRNTVSAKIHLWHPGDDVDAESGKRHPRTFAYRDANRTDAEYGVMTIQLDRTPPNFPEPELTREESEEYARRSLASLWTLLARVGDLTDTDTEPVRERQHDIDRLSRMLDSIHRQRPTRDDEAQVGLTYGR